MTAITLNDLTTGTVDGTGIFDKLMAATKAHLELEFRNTRIKGAEYAQVYLGQVTQVLQTSVSLLAEIQKIDLEAQLLQAQIDQTVAQTALINAQTNNAIQDVQKMYAEIRQLDAQTALAGQQLLNVQAEMLNLPKQGALIDAQTQVQINQAANEILQGNVLVDQDCLLKAQYDNTLQNTLNVAAQTSLYTQKVVTEKAQTIELGVDDNSVIGRQKALYAKQAAGFDRDAEQKVAKIMADTWSSRRMTDDATVADSTNMLDDATVGRTINKMLTGVGA